MFVWRSQNFFRWLNTMNFFSDTSPIRKSDDPLTVEQIVRHCLLILIVEVLNDFCGIFKFCIE